MKDYKTFYCRKKQKDLAENSNAESIELNVKSGIITMEVLPQTDFALTATADINKLDLDALLTNRELFQMKPQLAVDRVSGLKSYKRTNVQKKILIENASNQNKALSFVRVILGNQPIAFHIDNGANYSIVDSKFIEEMGLELETMERPYIIVVSLSHKIGEPNQTASTDVSTTHRIGKPNQTVATNVSTTHPIGSPI
ncbi:hypothetical protein BB561_003231 [Smittium simulii]|uniref:Uncharacterized protein n=1 Tax=Smittium simulii TaxID=133385 RepID=A0A2T9YMG1_9FUNG|nr:hypothetical protein BB561_003231 [Smittium simulii]